MLKESFIFKISQPLSTLLYNTKSDLKENEFKLPYDCCFIDSKIEFDNFRIEGICVYNAFHIEEKGEKEFSKEGIFSTCIVSELDENGSVTNNILLSFNMDLQKLNYSKEDINDFKFVEGKKNIEELRENIKNYIFNFIDFLNNPSIEFLTKTTQKSKLRGIASKSKGYSEIFVKGKLKRYVEVIGSYIKDSKLLRRAHWVRGHWRTFHSERFVNKVNEKTWIYPFIKGFGDALKKEYNLKDG